MMVAAVATLASAQPASSQEAGILSLIECSMRPRAAGSLTVDCEAIVPDEAAAEVASGITIVLANSATPSCYVAIVQPTQSGSCWRHQGRGPDPVRSLRLCRNPRDLGEYRLKLRLDPSGDGAACLRDPTVTMAVTAGAAAGEVTCTRNSPTGICLVPAVTDAQCENASSSRDCTTPASVDCEGPYNCKQPTKMCDPRPRTARRDAKHLACFPAQAGTPVVDSTGTSLGSLTESRVRLNYGIHRWIAGDEKVMAFSVETDRGTRTGWISRSQVSLVPADFMAVPALPAPGGPTSSRPIVSDGWSEADRNLHTDRGWCGTDVGQAWHYLSRSYGTVNLVWSTPGLGSPTAEVYPLGRNLVFQQSGVAPVDVPLYDCRQSAPVKTMRFVYGYVESGRWGWIAEANLGQPQPPPTLPPGETRDCSVGCCSGHQALNQRAGSEQECRNIAAQQCGSSPIRNLFFGGANIVHSDCVCCAKCKGFTRYHIVDGAEWGQCTSGSKALCKRHQRGFLDARWGDRANDQLCR